MAASMIRRFEKCAIIKNRDCCWSKPTTRTKERVAIPPLEISKRSALILISLTPLSLVPLPQTLLARERRNRKTIPLEDYLTSR